MRIDYKSFDMRILQLIEGGKNTFTKLQGDSDLMAHARKIWMQNDGDEFRVVDRRLQSLRKLGLIMYDGPKAGWSLLEPGERRLKMGSF